MALVAGKRAVRYAAADEEHGNSPASSLAKEIRPDLGFENDDDRRPDGAERSANAKSPVKRKVEYSVREGHPLSGERLPGDGCRGDDEWPARVFCFQTPGERDAGKHFTDGNSMNPNCAWTIKG